MFWKIHFVVYAVLTALITLGAISTADAETFSWDAWLSLLLGLVALIPLYGHAWDRAIGNRLVWGAVALGMLVLDIVIPLAQMLPHWEQFSWDHTRWTLVASEVIVVVLVLYFVAMVRYLLLRPELWRKT